MRIFTPAGPQVSLLSPEPLQSCEKGKNKRLHGKLTVQGKQQECGGLVSSPPKRNSKTPFVALDPGE